MTKAELAQAMAAFANKGGQVQQVTEGERVINSSLRYCKCGCEGNYTDHSMRQGEGRFADQGY